MTDLNLSAVGRRRTWPIVLSAFAAYSALAVFVTFPLVLHLSSRLPHDLGDPLLAASILWWNAHVMPLTERWWNGFGFYPATGMMALSAHFLGAGLIASPLQWLGAGPVTAYNLTFLASFPLCGIAAYALAWTLTKRHDAAIVCGLAYGFNPYRVAHVEHLELLLAFGMPAALAALHLYADTRRARWLVAFSAALAIQALCTSYYALFFTVFVGLWILWFMRPRAWREVLRIVAAGCVSVLVVSPVVLAYVRIHDDHNLTRDFDEILKGSADLSSLVTASPLSLLWGWTAVLNGAERQLFPGLTLTALAIAGAVLLRRSGPDVRDRLGSVATTLWAMSAVFAAIALVTRMAGPWHFEWGWLTVSATVPYKPLSLSAAFAIIAMLLSPPLRDAFRQRSALAFYLIAAAVLFLCSLGPKPMFLGEQILYEPPYAWLMRLPFFDDTARVPARFGMLGILALSVAGSIALTRLTSLTRHRVALTLVVMAVIIAEGGIRELPVPAVPHDGFRIPPGDRPAAVMELPLGNVWRDTAAMYRATLHGTRTVNGYNGHEPSAYAVLRRALADRDQTVLDALASFGPLLIATDNRVDTGQPWAAWLSDHPDVRRMTDESDWTLFRLPLKRRLASRDRGASAPLAIIAAFDARGQVDAATLTDQNPATRWITAHPQRVGDVLILDLGRLDQVSRLVLSMGSAAVLYPGALNVSTSVDNVAWKTGFVGTMGGPAFLAALENPRDARISIPLLGTATRFIRLSVEQSQPLYPWAVADIVVE